MTTTAVMTAAGPILAIDLGKYKYLACVYRTTTEPTFQTIDTPRADAARGQDPALLPHRVPVRGQPG